MKYSMTKPCDECPYLLGSGFSFRSLTEHASGEFACHKTCELTESADGNDSVFEPKQKSLHCAGALIFLEKQNAPHQMMRICERVGLYDHTKLDMNAPVVGKKSDCKKEPINNPERTQ